MAGEMVEENKNQKTHNPESSDLSTVGNVKGACHGVGGVWKGWSQKIQVFENEFCPEMICVSLML